MAETAAQIETRLRGQFPTMTESVNGVERTLSPAEYDAKMATWVAADLARQQREDLAATQKTLRSQVKIARTRLQQIRDATATINNTQRDAAIKDLATYLDGLIGVLIDTGVFRPDD